MAHRCLTALASERLPTSWMLAVATQLRRLPFLLAVLTAVFAVRAVGRHHALTRWMRALLRVGH